jgi:hypothetical protein
MPEKWVFPSSNLTEYVPIEFEESPGDKLPDWWKDQSQHVPVEPPCVPALNVAIPDELIDLPDGGAPPPEDEVDPRMIGRSSSRSYNTVGWNLVHSIHRVALGGHWSSDQCKAIIAEVFRVGAPHDPNQGVELPVPAELAWRHEVMDRFGLWARL